jgi:hypothetical protein
LILKKPWIRICIKSVGIRNPGEREIYVFHKWAREREKSRDAGSERMGKVVEIQAHLSKGFWPICHSGKQ